MILWRSHSIADLEPKFYADVMELLGSSPYAWHVTSSYRSLEDQAKLFGQGRTIAQVLKYGLPADTAQPQLKQVTKAWPGMSAHNYGLAIDVCLDGDDIKPGLQVIWDTNHRGWMWLKSATLKHPRLQGGWKFNDWPHIQKYQWKNYRNWQKPELIS
jgi:hypothetical protein